MSQTTPKEPISPTAPTGPKTKLGRPVVIGGKNITVYLSPESVLAARYIGNGSVSAGVRKVLKDAADKLHRELDAKEQK